MNITSITEIRITTVRNGKNIDSHTPYAIQSVGKNQIRLIEINTGEIKVLKVTNTNTAAHTTFYFCNGYNGNHEDIEQYEAYIKMVIKK